MMEINAVLNGFKAVEINFIFINIYLISYSVHRFIRRKSRISYEINLPCNNCKFRKHLGNILIAIYVCLKMR